MQPERPARTRSADAPWHNPVPAHDEPGQNNVKDADDAKGATDAPSVKDADDAKGATDAPSVKDASDAKGANDAQGETSADPAGQDGDSA
ncbi:hypothetical protein J5Y04_22860 [Kitasatospora sp. RG8]|uniref:hypothetical protein n=1 Tax=Kitasatospora sp. RG8 TaxID=2820815 RepID=UPI001ADFFFC4|nr:hypothetical protein [Kitasatospora sp. RG8]MBP0452362.1 hypothetical protein [Kitasatospora sp. RG8]